MTVTDFLDNLDLLAETPNAAASLRPLILHYAFRGVLTHRSAGDEPAERLLARSRAAMAEQMAKGEAKREKPPAPVAETEQAFPPPEGWAWCRLVDTGQFINGLAFKPSDWGPTGRPIIRIQNLTGRNTEYNRTTGTFDSDVLVQDGDILVSWSATLDAFIWRGEEGVLNQHIFRVLPSPLVDKRFLFWLLKWVIRQLAESDHAHGLVMTHINRGPFLAHPLPIPPLAEQKRIAARVDELMTLCDRLEAQQQQREHAHAALSRAALARFVKEPIPAILGLVIRENFAVDPQSMRPAVIRLAMQGTLTQQPASEAVASIDLRRAREEFALAGECVAELPVRDDERPFETPRSWPWVRLGEIARIKHGFAFPSMGFTSRVTPFVLTTPGSFYERGGFRDRGARTKYYDGPVDPAFVLKAGNLIIPMTEQAAGLLGSPAFVPADGKTYIHNQRIGKIELATAVVVPEFVYWFFNTEFFRGELARTSTGMKVRHTSPKRVLTVPIPVPPVAEQRRIVAKVNDLMALLDRLEDHLAAASTTGEKLMDAVVAELTA